MCVFIYWCHMYTYLYIQYQYLGGCVLIHSRKRRLRAPYFSVYAACAGEGLQHGMCSLITRYSLNRMFSLNIMCSLITRCSLNESPNE